MTFLEWLNLNPGWFVLYLLIGACLIPMALESLSNIVETSDIRNHSGSAIMWLMGWVLLGLSLLTGGIWIVTSFPLWMIALGALTFAVILLVLPFVVITIKEWRTKHTS